MKKCLSLPTWDLQPHPHPPHQHEPPIHQGGKKSADSTILVNAQKEVNTALPMCAGILVAFGNTQQKGAPNNPTELQRAHTTLHHFQFKSGLEFHPDRAWVSWLLYGIKYIYGVKIGYNSLQSLIKSKNLPSAYEYPHIIDAELTKERAAGRILGPFTSPPFPTLYCSGLGVVPNKNGKWRMIMHLSAPVGQSIID